MAATRNPRPAGDRTGDDEMALGFDCNDDVPRAPHDPYAPADHPAWCGRQTCHLITVAGRVTPVHERFLPLTHLESYVGPDGSRQDMVVVDHFEVVSAREARALAEELRLAARWFGRAGQ